MSYLKDSSLLHTVQITESVSAPHHHRHGHRTHMALQTRHISSTDITSLIKDLSLSLTRRGPGSTVYLTLTYCYRIRSRAPRNCARQSPVLDQCRCAHTALLGLSRSSLQRRFFSRRRMLRRAPAAIISPFPIHSPPRAVPRANFRAGSPSSRSHWREPPRRAESVARGGRVDGLLSEALTPAALTGRTVAASDRREINGRGGAREDRSDKAAELLRRRCSPAEEPRLAAAAAAAAFDCARSFLRPSPLRDLVCVFLFLGSSFETLSRLSSSRRTPG